MTIRLARPSDRAALVALAERLTAFELPPWRTAAEIATADADAMLAAIDSGTADSEVWIAERSGVVAGCLHMLSVTDFFGRAHAHVSVLATTKEAEGSGVGRALLAYGETWARDRGLALITLNVFAANSRARGFYEKSGWTPETLKYIKPL